MPLQRQQQVRSLGQWFSHGPFYASVMWEYVESHANWSENASRALLRCDWCHELNFKLQPFTFPSWVWTAQPESLASKVAYEVAARLSQQIRV